MAGWQDVCEARSLREDGDARTCLPDVGAGKPGGCAGGVGSGGGGALRGGAAAVSPQSFRTRKVGSNLGEELPRTRQGWSRSQDAEQEVQWVEFVGERAHLFFFLFLNN